MKVQETEKKKSPIQGQTRQRNAFEPVRTVVKLTNLTRMANVQMVFYELIESRWIDEGTDMQDFLKPFSGRDTGVKIEWTGKMGIGALRKLFEMMLEEKFIECNGCRLTTILRSHFVQKDKLTGTFKSIGDFRGCSYTHKSDSLIKTCCDWLEYIPD